MQLLEFTQSVFSVPCLPKTNKYMESLADLQTIKKNKKNPTKHFQLQHSGCVPHVPFASCAIVCCRQTNPQLCAWLRTKPECLVIVQSVIFPRDDLLNFLFLLLQMGLFFFLFLFFSNLKEIVCICQVYCMKVFTEPCCTLQVPL